MDKNKTAAECVHRTSTTYLKQAPYYFAKLSKSQAFSNNHKLPSPSFMLQKLGIEPHKTNAAGFWVLTCPFHKDGKEKHPSLNLHKEQGFYLCHACGSKGGDIIAFYQAVTGCSFKQTLRLLHIWGLK